MNIEQKLQEAISKHEEGKLDEAENLYQCILEAQPMHLDALNNLGLLLHQLGKLADAEINCKKAIEIKLDFAEAHFNLGNILFTLNRLGEAELSYKRVLELKPEHDKANNNLGVVLNQLNRLEEAIKSFKKAITLNPTSNEFRKNFDETVAQNEMLLLNNKISNSKKENITLDFNSLIFNRIVEKELISKLYEINSIEVGKPKDIRYGNGRCSNDQLFKNEISIIKKIEKNLIDIIKKSVKSEIYILESFFNILRAGSGTIKHNHISAFDKNNKLVNQKYSLTYYLSVGDQNCNEPGILKLYKPE